MPKSHLESPTKELAVECTVSFAARAHHSQVGLLALGWVLDIGGRGSSTGSATRRGGQLTHSPRASCAKFQHFSWRDAGGRKKRSAQLMRDGARKKLHVAPRLVC